MHGEDYSSLEEGKAADYITNNDIIGVLWGPFNDRSAKL
jgi:hypothetical protein